MNKTEVDSIVSTLVGTGNPVRCPSCDIGFTVDSQIKIGDILEKIREKYPTSWENYYDSLILFWAFCQKSFKDKKSLSKSLQQIIAESGYEEIEHYRGEQEPLMEQVLKSPAKELLENIKALIDLLK